MTLAWYAAYGSNTDLDRFSRYLARCSQPADPLDHRALRLDLPLYFAQERTSWGPGGVAFASTARTEPSATLARAWLLPVARIAEVGAMENGRDPAEGVLDLAAVRASGMVSAFDGWYDAWVDCGELDGMPVVTLTSSADHEPNPPGQRYATVVACGLRDSHGLTAADAAAYLAPRSGLSLHTLLAWQQEGEGYAEAE